MRPASVRIWSLSAVVIVERAELTTPTGLFRFWPLSWMDGMGLVVLTVLVVVVEAAVVRLDGITAAVLACAAVEADVPALLAAVVVVVVVVVVPRVVVEGWFDEERGRLADVGARAPDMVGCPWDWGAERAGETGLVTG